MRILRLLAGGVAGLLLASGACSGGGGGDAVAVADVPAAEIPAGDVPIADVPIADVPTADVLSADGDTLSADGDAGSDVLALAALNIPATFSYRTSADVSLAVTVLRPDGTPWTGVVVLVFDDTADPPDPASLVQRGLTDASGQWSPTLTLPAAHDTVTVVASAVGITNQALVAVGSGQGSVAFGGEVTP